MTITKEKIGYVMADNYLKIENISKSYGQVSGDNAVRVLDKINFEVDEGSFVVLFGPNGCGKTTLLNIIAGISKPDHGGLKFINEEKRKISYIFQNFAETLLPWKSCLDNISFPLELENVEKNERRRLAIDLLKKLDLQIPIHQYPYQCSVGQKQLVAIARGLINNPAVLLMDEPFVSLDYDTRISIENKLLDIWRKTMTTIVFVSHDLDEAIYLSDKVVILSKKPTHVIAEIPIRLPRPRRHSMIGTQEFLQNKKSVLDYYGDSR